MSDHHTYGSSTKKALETTTLVQRQLCVLKNRYEDSSLKGILSLKIKLILNENLGENMKIVSCPP